MRRIPQIGRAGDGGPGRRSFWADATPRFPPPLHPPGVVGSRPRGGGVLERSGVGGRCAGVRFVGGRFVGGRRAGRRCAGGSGSGTGVELAGRRAAPDRAPLSRPAHALLDRTPRHRHRRPRHPGARPGRRHRALRRNGGGPRRTLDRAPGRPAVELRTRRHHAPRRRPGASRRSGGHPPTRALLGALPALRRPPRRRVRVAAALPRRDAAVGAAAHTGGRDRAGHGLVETVRRGGAPSRSSP